MHSIVKVKEFSVIKVWKVLIKNIQCAKSIVQIPFTLPVYDLDCIESENLCGTL